MTIGVDEILNIQRKCKESSRYCSAFTLHFSDANQLQKLTKSENTKKYDIVSVVPKSFTAFQLACACKDIDLISFDASEHPIFMNRKTYNLAVANSIYFEVPYAPAIADSGKRRTTIQVAHAYHTYGKSKNIILSSGPLLGLFSSSEVHMHSC
ncbi:ribonuclease P protein subunit p30-like [Homalodisca vitripennis]|uniref:ribonuclease P protein subunit p30-like n=1 Tax=Homalodisca vitripennis TaxID=197043 RepID=UPI001EEB4E55|nr:ribonuclease P protein subunit p30-like [Homalodisca vitripennis]